MEQINPMLSTQIKRKLRHWQLYDAADWMLNWSLELHQVWRQESGHLIWYCIGPCVPMQWECFTQGRAGGSTAATEASLQRALRVSWLISFRAAVAMNALSSNCSRRASSVWSKGFGSCDLWTNSKMSMKWHIRTKKRLRNLIA